MGSGGGGWQPPRGLSSSDALKGSVSQEERSAYESEANGYFADLLKDYNNRDTEGASKHIDEIKNALESEYGTVTLRYGGSLAKHTYVDGLSDIDMLCILNKSDLAGENATQAKEYLAKRLHERYPNSEITIGNLAVTIHFTDGTDIQILPAISTKTGVRIPKGEGTGWSNVTRPAEFARELTAVNESTGGKVVPVIKLFKAVNSELPEDSRISGYHAEALAVDAFQSYQGNLNYKDMLTHLCEHASESIDKPLVDSTGQSTNVDDNLGPANSPERKKASVAFQRLADRMKRADSGASLAQWQQIMGD